MLIVPSQRTLAELFFALWEDFLRAGPTLVGCPFHRRDVCSSCCCALYFVLHVFSAFSSSCLRVGGLAYGGRRQSFFGRRPKHFHLRALPDLLGTVLPGGATPGQSSMALCTGRFRRFFALGRSFWFSRQARRGRFAHVRVVDVEVVFCPAAGAARSEVRKNTSFPLALASRNADSCSALAEEISPMQPASLSQPPTPPGSYS